MGTYDKLTPYPLPYIQKLSADLAAVLVREIGDENGLHLGTAVAILGKSAGGLASPEKNADTLMGVAVAWGVMLGLPGMHEVGDPQGSQVERSISPDESNKVSELLQSSLLENGARAETWSTLMVIAAMDLIFQARSVIQPAIPKTILLAGIAEGAAARG